MKKAKVRVGVICVCLLCSCQPHSMDAGLRMLCVAGLYHRRRCQAIQADFTLS